MSDPDDRVTYYNSCISWSSSNDIWCVQKSIFSTKRWGSIYAKDNGFFLVFQENMAASTERNN